MTDTLAVLNRLATDQKEIAERQWRAPVRARVAQSACDVGLFSDDARQADLFSASANKGK